MRDRRAFTLLELMVSTAIALIVVSAATSAIFIITRALNRSGQSSAADTEAQIVTEYLVSQLQAIGGGAVRPWMVFTVDNNSGAEGSDVVAFGDVPVELPPGQSITRTMSPGKYSLFVLQSTDRRGVQTGECALARMRKDKDGDGFPDPASASASAYAASDLVGQQAILTSPIGDTWRSVVIIDAGFAASFDGCFVRFALDGTTVKRNGAFARADNFSGTTGVEDPDEWVLGQVSFVRARTWRLQPVAGEVGGRIIETLSTPGRNTDGNFSADRVLLEGVRDLQVSPGYDVGGDGAIVETSGGLDDEWLNSVPGDHGGNLDRIPEDLRAASPAAPRDVLRMIDLAVVLQLPRAERSQSVRAFDGAVKTGPEARLASGRAYLRNLLLFF